MSLCILALVLVPLVGLSSGQPVAITCVQVPGALVQIDAGNGQVFGVTAANSIYTLYGGTWFQVPGALTHVTVGPAGVWGVNSNSNIFKMVGGDWVQTDGLLKQIDAGGASFVVGANTNDDVFCLSESSTIYVKDGSALPWANIADGKLEYYSCGPQGCWGVNAAGNIFFRSSVTSECCTGVSWQQVAGNLVMLEVGTDGSVYGVNKPGNLFHREGITLDNPMGTLWRPLSSSFKPFKHVSVDLDNIWVITIDQRILKCQL